MEKDNKEIKQKNTIKKFIEENDKLLTAFSIFIALTLFASSLENELIGIFLSFLFLSVAILIWFEMIRSLPIIENEFSTLGYFSNIIWIIGISIIAFWIYNYKELWTWAMTFVFWGVFGIGILKLLEKLKLYKLILKIRFLRNENTLKTIAMILAIPYAIFCFLLSSFIWRTLAPLAINYIENTLL